MCERLWLGQQADGADRGSPLMKPYRVPSRSAISPSGDWVAYTSDESGSSEVYVARFPSLEDRQAVSIGEGWAPLWSSLYDKHRPPGEALRRGGWWSH